MSNVSKLPNLRDTDDVIWKKDGNGGDGMSDNLEKRVEKLEDGMSAVKLDLVRLTERSEQFVTKADLSELNGDLKSEIIGLKGDIKASVAEINLYTFKAIKESQESTLKVVQDRFDKLDEIARWKWGNIIIPIVMGVFGAVVAYLVAKAGA
ncbi:hypothetical protein [Klebsiella grimontii]|uniref:hypothetical protein n=1 Tax=Klebsiella grimontii TaxID=2058152 RepID=UPI0018998A1F|nr:hypothetical protein [Klebsiella grimontii]